LIFTITGKHIEITDALKAHAEEKTSKLPRFFSSINQIEVIIDANQGVKLSVELIARA
jgi:ribosomal subunit interface protein